MSKKDEKALAKQESRGGGPLTLRDAMGRLFDESVWDPFGLFAHDPFFSSEPSLMATKIPSMDVSETKKELSITMDVPGYSPENVKVEVEDDNLVISGESSREEEVKEKKYYRKERSSGSFQRCVKLPAYADASKINCQIKNGTLEIKIPKKEGVGKREIKIDVK